jgi:HAD superfamily hydrolase (TIGR01490 family)
VALALFDLDRTLVRKDTAGLFIRYEHRNGLTSSARVARVAWWRLLYGVGVVDHAQVAARVLLWYRGRPESELRQHMQVWFGTDVRHLVSERGRRVMDEHRRRGDRVAIVTASSRYSAEPVAKELSVGADDLICSELRVEDGILTGDLDGPLCYGPEKVVKVKEYLERLAGMDREIYDLSEAILYTDSVTDLPLLRAVGYPVVVNPDLRLRWLARRYAWPIQQW